MNIDWFKKVIKLFFFSLLVMVSPVVLGQSNQWDIGLFAGVGRTSLMSTADGATGYMFGPAVHYRFSESVGISTGWWLTGKRAKYSIVLTDANGVPLGTTTAYYTFDYRVVPLLGRFNLGKVFFMEAGPYAGFLRKAKYAIYGVSGQGTAMVTDDFRATDYGIMLGWGADFPLGSYLNMNIQLQYSHGLQDIREVPVTGTEDRTSTAFLMLGLNYRLGRE